MGSNKAGKRIPERGQYGNNRGKERQRRRIDNRERDPRYQAAMEETRAAQAALDEQIAREAANPVLGHTEGALLQKRLEEAREREAALEAEQPLCEGLAPFNCGNPSCPAHGEQSLTTVGKPVVALEGMPMEPVSLPTWRTEAVDVPDGYEVVLRPVRAPFNIDSVPAKQTSTTWVLGSARQMLIKGYSLAHVVETTGWGKDWFNDIPIDQDGYGLGTEAWLESLDKKDKKKGLSS